MVLPDELAWLLRSLDESGIPYAVTGSLASSSWGRPRATYDADILIALRGADVDRLIAMLPAPDWYVDRQAVLEAIAGGGEFNAIHAASGTKVDFWMRGSSVYEAIRFARRRRQRINGAEAWLLSPEDTILAKLQWMQAAASERQRQDVAGIIAVQADALDWTYLREWADRLGVTGLLAQCDITK